MADVVVESEHVDKDQVFMVATRSCHSDNIYDMIVRDACVAVNTRQELWEIIGDLM